MIEKSWDCWRGNQKDPKWDKNCNSQTWWIGQQICADRKERVQIKKSTKSKMISDKEMIDSLKKDKDSLRKKLDNEKKKIQQAEMEIEEGKKIQA